MRLGSEVSRRYLHLLHLSHCTQIPVPSQCETELTNRHLIQTTGSRLLAKMTRTDQSTPLGFLTRTTLHYCTVHYCAVHYCAAQSTTALSTTAPRCPLLRCPLLRRAVHYCAVHYCAAHYYALLCWTMHTLRCALLRCALLHCALYPLPTKRSKWCESR